MLKNLAIENDVVISDEDRLGGEGPFIVDSGVYPLRIDLAYLELSQGGALALKCVFTGTELPALTVRQTYWLTSGTAKGGKNYYLDSEGNKRLLPGMISGDHLAQLVTGKHLAQLDEEEKVVKMYNWDAKKEVPTKIRAVTDLMGKTCLGGLLRKIENKRVQTSAGEWAAGADKREFNELDKAFDDAGFTVTEKLAQASTPEFIGKWKAKWEGKTVDNFDASVKNTAVPGIPAGASETKPLFD